MPSSRWLSLALSFALLAVAVLEGCGSSSEILARATACTVDADCSGNAWCQEGTCQAAYTLVVRTTPGLASDAKVHANGVVQLSVDVTGGGTASAPPVMLSFVDEGRLQSVGSPAYSPTRAPTG
jgi:hypothetical protein